MTSAADIWGKDKSGLSCKIEGHFALSSCFAWKIIQVFFLSIQIIKFHYKDREASIKIPIKIPMAAKAALHFCQNQVLSACNLPRAQHVIP